MENKKTFEKIETTQRLSRDGKWFITKTTITDIKPMSYMEKVLKGSN